MAFFVTGAIIGGAAGLGSALIGSNAASNAADKQAAAANNALAFQKQAYADSQPRFAAANTAFGNAQGTVNSAYGNAQGQANANFQPYMDMGKNATYTLGQLTGNNGGNQPDFSSFYNSPDYAFAQQQGELGIERGANARGNNLSGGTLKDLATFNSGLATQQYGNYFNRLMGLSQLGQTAAGGFTSATTNNANGLANATTNIAGGIGNLATGQANANSAMAGQIGNTTQAIGQAQASGIVGGANAITGGINGAANNALLAGYMNRNPSAYGSGSTSTGGANVGYDANGQMFGG